MVFLLIYAVINSIINHGKSAGENNACTTFIAALIFFGLLWGGGFFS